MYEIREFKDCCYDLGFSYLRSTGLFHTWTNNTVWCKLDRAMVNNAWIQKGFNAQANFDPQENYQTILPTQSLYLEIMIEGPPL